LKEIAPIVLFVYNRPDHTKRTVESLSKNILADQSTLIVYSDGAKSKDDSVKVINVRKYIHNITGFKKLEIIERDKNFGLANSVITGVNEVLNNYGKVIVLEDDIFTSISFLFFMNKALEYYNNEEKIFSISGYTYPIDLPTNFQAEIFIAYRPASWGWATWKDRWCKVDWDMDNFKSIVKDITIQRDFNSAGEDLFPMLKYQMEGKVDSWAIRWAYTHYKNNSYCLYPISSLCKNIGMDNSGIHSAPSNKFNVELQKSFRDFVLKKELVLNDEINEGIKTLVKPSLIRKSINYIKMKL